MHNERKPLSLNTKISESETVFYTVKSILGYGGTGITYKCISSADGYYYCLKELYPTELADCLIRQDDGRIGFNSMFKNKDLFETWNWYNKNLIKESNKQQSTAVDKNDEVNDPYFLKSHGTFTASNGNLYARYDIQKGRTLSQSYDELSLNELMSVIITACKKLDSLHTSKRFLHLDLSPSNIFIIDNALGKEAYFLDFGNSKAIDATDENHRFSATEGFSPQEILARCEGNNSSIYKIGPYSDTYSLVAILFKALVGDVFSADHRIEPELWKHKVRIKLEENGASKATDCLISILSKGLSEQKKRYQSASELMSDLYRANELISGENTEINILIANIENRITIFEKGLNDLKTVTLHDGKKTRNFMGTIAACLAIVIICAFAVLSFCDFEAPKITPQGCATTDDGAIEIYGDSFVCSLVLTDNKGIGWHNITPSDILFDGFSAECYFDSSNFNSYSLKLLNIQRTSNSACIIIKGDCVKDINEIPLEETRIPIVFKDKKGDISQPTVNIAGPFSTEDNNLVKSGTNVTYDLYVADNTQLKDVNITSEYIHTVDFDYENLLINGTDGRYSITFVNVSGGNGKHHIYIAPGAAVDTNDNYSHGVQSYSFYLYDHDENVDTSSPAMTISAAEIKGTTVEYRISVNDNVGVRSFGITEHDITPVGFSADVQIEYMATSSETNSVRIVRFTNIKSTSNSNEKYFIINSGVAKDAFDNQTKAKISPCFSIP